MAHYRSARGAGGLVSAAEEVAGLPLHVSRLTPTAIRLWVGDYGSSTAVVAFATSKGIVVADTIGFPTLDAQLRRVIARELGRSDFKVLINTHEHSDHTRGNAAYNDCTIIGHEKVGPGIAAAASEPPAADRGLQQENRRVGATACQARCELG